MSERVGVEPILVVGIEQHQEMNLYEYLSWLPPTILSLSKDYLCSTV